MPKQLACTFSNNTFTYTASFIIFDVDGDGFISSEDMSKVLNLLVGTNMSHDTVAEVIRRTMDTADMDRDGRISFEDFSQSCALVPWNALTVPIKSSSRHEVEVALAQNASFGKPVPVHDFS